MKRILLFASLVLVLSSCVKRHNALIQVAISDADTTAVILQKLNFNKLQPIDTIKTDESGNFEYTVELVGDAPEFYYLYCNGNKVASMILLPGDKVSINTDLKGDYTVTGSEESLKLKELETELATVKTKMATVAAQATDDMTDAQIKQINSQLSRLYIDYKRNLIKRMMTDPTSLTSAIAAFYKINDDLPVFNDNTDAILFRTVYNELSQVYPKSEYLQALLDETEKRERIMEFEYKLQDFEEIGFPDISMPDVNGDDKSLKDLKGNVIMLMFWSASLDDHKMLNLDLIDIYSKYHDKGFEVYQVALDIDKTYWASIVKSQNLPWISVNDGLGLDSPSILMYNVQAIPATFFISRDGDVIAKDIVDAASIEDQINKML